MTDILHPNDCDTMYQRHFSPTTAVNDEKSNEMLTEDDQYLLSYLQIEINIKMIKQENK